MKLVFASHNQDKVVELQDALSGLPLEVSSARDHPQVGEIEETGATLEENALLKARTLFQATGVLCLADDTGLEVEALGGAPGVRSARYGGPEQSYEKNLTKLLAEMSQFPPDERRARFRTVIAIVFPDASELVMEGVCEGLILSEPRGESGFGYDPVFFIPERSKTFAEMSLEEKQELSHRGRAMRKARSMLVSFLTKESTAPDQE